MGSFAVDVEAGVVRFRLSGNLTVAEARAFVTAHNAAIDRLGDRAYVVFGDLRDLHTLSPACAAIVEEAKHHSARKSNFRGSAILVKDALVALQHRRTSVTGGVIATELISTSEEECRQHLASLRR